MKKYQITINEIEVEENAGSGQNPNSLENRKKTLDTILDILKIVEALLFLAIAIISFLSNQADSTLKLPTIKISLPKKALNN